MSARLPVVVLVLQSCDKEARQQRKISEKSAKNIGLSGNIVNKINYMQADKKSCAISGKQVGKSGKLPGNAIPMV